MRRLQRRIKKNVEMELYGIGNTVRCRVTPSNFITYKEKVKLTPKWLTNAPDASAQSHGVANSATLKVTIVRARSVGKRARTGTQ